MSKEKELNVSEALGFTDDLMFQIVMRDPEICRMFLNEVLPHLDIQDITVRTQERIAFNQEDKVSILDVLITDSRGRRYNVEMQVAHKADMDKRARQYLFKMMEEGMHEATVAAIHKTINMLRRMKCSPKQILQELEQDYGNEFSEEELADFVKNA